MMEYTGCGFCLDFVHAVCAANFLHREPYEYVEELMKFEPAIFHLSDLSKMGSPWDEHCHLGHGMLDIGRCLRNCSERLLTIETDKDSRDSLSDFCEDISWLRHCQLEY